MASIGKNIRRLREHAGFKSQGAFAVAIGVPQPRVSDWENDRYGLPELPSLLKIAKALGVSIDDLLRQVDPEYDQVLRDLACHAESLQPDSSEKGVTGGPSAARLLAERLHRDRALAGEVQDVIRQLTHISEVLQGKDRLSQTHAPRGRRGDRKIG